MTKLLKTILRILAKRTIHRYQPIVIAITGSVGKTTTKEAIYEVLRRKFTIRKNHENFNNELGVPLAVLNIAPKPKNFRGNVLWWRVGFVFNLLRAVVVAYGLKAKYPKMLLLELAADRPGDIKYLVDMVKPSIGIVTAVGEVPVHVEFYTSPKAVAREKAVLIESLPSDGLAILNYDDQTVLDMKEKSSARVVTIGFSEHADIWVSDISYIVSENLGPSSDREEYLGGLSFKIHQESTFVPFRINKLVGVHQLYGVLAVVAVGTHFGINMVEIASILESFEPPKDRMTLVGGIRNTVIINDVYNASPISTHAALDTLRDFGNNMMTLRGKGRKIAVLGDMKELGKYSVEAHRVIGNLAGERADILITVGDHAKLIADSAANQMKKDSIFSFATSEEAKAKVQEIIQEGDIVLIKGSRSMKMEVILKDIAAIV